MVDRAKYSPPFLLLSLILFTSLSFFPSSADASSIFSVTASVGEEPAITANYPLVYPGHSINVTFRITYSLSAPQIVELHIYMLNNTIGWTPSNFMWSGELQAGVLTTVDFAITAPLNVGVEAIYWGATVVGLGPVGHIATTHIEISCSDGDSCDGDELFVAGQCVPAVVPFCDDGNDCTIDECDSELGLCHMTLKKSTCEQCIKNCEVYVGCGGKQCGTDSCGGTCGECDATHYCDSDGQCVQVNTPGVCTNPIDLLLDYTNLTGVYTFTGNTSTGFHKHVIPCNYASTSPELVYRFTVPVGQTYGFDFRTSGMDTVLDVRKNGCEGEFIGCNDDGTPPGNYGSRVARMIGEGVYYVIVKGYNVDIQGEFLLYMSFQYNCIPKCNSQYCGSDECGGTCGECGDGEQCSENFRCEPINCVPNCDAKECGLDGCGGSCGDCADGKLCNIEESTCLFFPYCDGLNPVCNGCNDEQYCASDCTCYNLTSPLPDLFVERERLGSDIMFDSDIFKETSCAYREGCISGTGRRRLLRFSVLTTNQGRADAVLPHPASRPDLFTWSPCHGHYYFDDYAYYALLSRDGKTVVEQGRKQGHCVFDGSRRTNGSVDCVGTYNCDCQGLSVGWAATYTYDLDCQWIDITSVEAGDYLLYVEVNRMRKIVESDYSNNKAWVPVTIPPWNQGGSTTGDVITTTICEASTGLGASTTGHGASTTGEATTGHGASTTGQATDAPTNPPTESPTEAPTTPATNPPTNPATNPPTNPATNPPTEAPTNQPEASASTISIAFACILICILFLF